MKKILIVFILIVSSAQAWDTPQLYCKEGTHQVIIFGGKTVKDSKTGKSTFVEDKGRPITKCVKNKSKK